MRSERTQGWHPHFSLPHSVCLKCAVAGGSLGKLGHELPMHLLCALGRVLRFSGPHALSSKMSGLDWMSFPFLSRLKTLWFFHDFFVCFSSNLFQSGVWKRKGKEREPSPVDPFHLLLTLNVGGTQYCCDRCPAVLGGAAVPKLTQSVRDKPITQTSSGSFLGNACSSLCASFQGCTAYQEGRRKGGWSAIGGRGCRG